ncbi:hypothetical protein C8T65DRAFT_668559 [Cerioporus squamosus]|nr:hypothetical protein C8T65DRAFT_668559 [Cerioporus squamosus]
MSLSVARVLQQRLPGTLCRRVLAAPRHACPGRPSCVRKPLSPSRTTRDGILHARAPEQTWVSSGLLGDVSPRLGAAGSLPETPTHLHVGAAPSRRPQAARNHSGLPDSTGGATYDVPVAKDVCVELRPQQTSSRWSSSGLLTAVDRLFSVSVADASRRSLASSRRDSRAADGGEMLLMFGLWSLPAVPGAPGLFSDFQSSDAGLGPSQVLCARSRADTGVSRQAGRRVNMPWRGGICASRGQHASARRDIAAAEGRHSNSGLPVAAKYASRSSRRPHGVVRQTSSRGNFSRQTACASPGLQTAARLASPGRDSASPASETAMRFCQRERVAAVRKVRSCVRVGDGDSSFDSQLSLPAVQGAPGLSRAASNPPRCQRVASACPESRGKCQTSQLTSPGRESASQRRGRWWWKETETAVMRDSPSAG